MLQELSWSEHFRKYFKRWRRADGLAMMEEDKEYTRRHGIGRGSESTLDHIIVKAVTDWSGSAPAFFEHLTKALVRTCRPISPYPECFLAPISFGSKQIQRSGLQRNRRLRYQYADRISLLLRYR